MKRYKITTESNTDIGIVKDPKRKGVDDHCIFDKITKTVDKKMLRGYRGCAKQFFRLAPTIVPGYYIGSVQVEIGKGIRIINYYVKS